MPCGRSAAVDVTTSTSQVQRGAAGRRRYGPKLLIPIWSEERISVTNTLNYHNQSLRQTISSHSFLPFFCTPTTRSDYLHSFNANPIHYGGRINQTAKKCHCILMTRSGLMAGWQPLLILLPLPAWP